MKEELKSAKLRLGDKFKKKSYGKQRRQHSKESNKNSHKGEENIKNPDQLKKKQKPYNMVDTLQLNHT